MRFACCKRGFFTEMAERVGFEPTSPFEATRFRGELFQPLRHLSAFYSSGRARARQSARDACVRTANHVARAQRESRRSEFAAH